MLLIVGLALWRGPWRSPVPTMNDGDTIPYDSAPRRDPYEVVGVKRGDSPEVMRAAYRKGARALHPDASGDASTAAAFQELVTAFKQLCTIKPGSLETHPLWPKLSGLDRYWSRELGYDMAFGNETADGLEEWLIATTKLDDYVDENGVELPGLDPSSLEAERLRELGKRTEAEAQAAVAPAAAEEEKAAAAEEEEAAAAEEEEVVLEEEVVVLEEVVLEEEVVEEVVVEEESAVGISELLAYRVFLGNEQWRVRWADGGGDDDGGEAEESWERYRVLDTEPLRRQAEMLRARAAGGG